MKVRVGETRSLWLLLVGIKEKGLIEDIENPASKFKVKH